MSPVLCSQNKQQKPDCEEVFKYLKYVLPGEILLKGDQIRDLLNHESEIRNIEKLHNFVQNKHERNFLKHVSSCVKKKHEQLTKDTYSNGNNYLASFFYLRTYDYPYTEKDTVVPNILKNNMPETYQYFMQEEN